jgi:hypothetical protein
MSSGDFQVGSCRILPLVGQLMSPAPRRLARLRCMNGEKVETGAIREIEPEVSALFTKLVETDPRETDLDVYKY